MHLYTGASALSDHMSKKMAAGEVDYVYHNTWDKFTGVNASDTMKRGVKKEKSNTKKEKSNTKKKKKKSNTKKKQP